MRDLEPLRSEPEDGRVYLDRVDLEDQARADRADRRRDELQDAEHDQAADEDDGR